jgi:hypothetical protein
MRVARGNFMETPFRATLNRIRRCAASLKNFPKSAVAHHLKCGLPLN